jgi:hypothetical protein
VTRMGFAMFFPPTRSPESKSDLLNASVNQQNHFRLKA